MCDRICNFFRSCCGEDIQKQKQHEIDFEKFDAMQQQRNQLRRQLQASNKKIKELQAEPQKDRNRQGNEFLGNNKRIEVNQVELQNKRKLDSLQQQLLRNASENKILLSTTEQQRNIILNYEQTMIQLQRDIENYKSQLIKNKELISLLQAKNRQFAQENQQLKQENKSLKAKLDANRNSQHSQSIPAYLVHRATKFFSGDVLNQFDDYKIYLTDTLEKEMGLDIKRTQLLFRYEKAFPRNLHQPIDGQSPIVVLIKTVKGYHIACVSEAPFAPRSNKQGRGWLISLTKGRVYRAAVGKQAILYDEMYLIFGNQEIRIDGSSNRVFSNFGISNSFYNTTGNDVRDFLGPGLEGTPREAELESFEIFRLYAE